MDLRRLASFLAVVDEGSFTRAARRLGIAQPSLSQQIRTLEAELGGPLLERLPRGIRVTAAGKAFLPEARSAVRAAERASTAARLALGIEAGELEVATLLSMTVGILPGRSSAGIARIRRSRVRMREYTHRALLEEHVRAGSATSRSARSRRLGGAGRVGSGTRSSSSSCRASDPLAGRQSIPLEALADRLWILFQPGHGLNDVVERACAPPASSRGSACGRRRWRRRHASRRRASVRRSCPTTCHDRPRRHRRQARPAGRPRAGRVHAERVVAARGDVPRGAETGSVEAPPGTHATAL